MTTVVELINGLMTLLFRGLLWPFRSLDPVWAILVISVLSGLFMLWIFAITSNQEGIRVSKDKVRGNLIGVRLFQHDIGVVLKLQGAIFRETLRYMRYSLAPVAVLLLPILLILVQLNLFFSFRPLAVGEQSILTARFSGVSVLDEAIYLEASPAFELESPPVRIPGREEVSWRIKAVQEGTHEISLKVGDESVKKNLVIGKDWTAISPVRTDDAVDLFLFSGEASMPNPGKVKSVDVRYSQLPLSVFGIPMDWLVLFFVLSMISAFAFKGWLGVEL